MFSSLAVAAFAAAPALAGPVINAYWGQSGNTRLRDWCDQNTFEYVTVGFVNISPENDESGLNYPGTDFGANCAADVYGSSQLLSKCTQIAADIPYCQSKGKKVLLSIGGAVGDYEVTTPANGEYFAQFLWEAFGPYNSNSAAPRPFDLPNQHITVDGFDFDIEIDLPNTSGYPAMVTKLRQLIGNGNYLITAAPECPLDPQYFKLQYLIDNAKFDALFIQFYNNPGCDATTQNFNYDDWVEYLEDTPSSDAKLFIGLPGSPTSAGSGYVEPHVVDELLETYRNKPQFGGIMLWDLQSSTDHKVGGLSYIGHMHDLVVGTLPPTPSSSGVPSPTPTVCVNEYTVKGGDNCYEIGQVYGLSVADILKLNPFLSADCYLDVGDKLCLQTGPAPPSSSIPSTPAPSASVPSSSVPSASIPSSYVHSSSAAPGSSVSSSVPVSSVHSASVSASAVPSSVSVSEAPSVTPSSVSSISSTSDEYCEEESTTESLPSSVPSSSLPLSSVPPSSLPPSSVPSGEAPSVTPPSVSASDVPSVTPSSVPSSVSSTSDEYCYESSTESSYIPSSSVSVPVSSNVPAPSSVPASSSVPSSGPGSSTSSGSVWPSSTPSITSSSGPISSTSSGWEWSSSSVEMTTSTVYSTTTYTVSKCPPTVTNCPYGHVVTQTIAVSTTICPVTTVPTTTATPTDWPHGGWTTSTVYSTTTYTISKCPPTVKNCPYGHVTTEIVPVSTTVCPVTEGDWPKPTNTGIIVPTWQPEADWTTRTSVTNTQFTTLTVPNPDKPVGGGPATGPAGGPATWPAKPVSETKPAGWPAGAATPSASGWGGARPGSSSVPVTAGAGRNSAALGLFGLAAVLFLAL